MITLRFLSVWCRVLYGVEYYKKSHSGCDSSDSSTNLKWLSLIIFIRLINHTDLTIEPRHECVQMCEQCVSLQELVLSNWNKLNTYINIQQWDFNRNSQA